MLIILFAYLGGALTIVSPCILPVLPFVFARSGQPFARNGLPLLLGMSLTFALVATLAAVGGGWVVRANEYGRDAAVLLLGLFGLTLVFPALSDHLTRPLVALGDRLSRPSIGGQSSAATAFVLGIATGLLWSPCAGPILGLLLTGAALQGASGRTSLLLLAYGLGAATSLAAALLVGGRVLAALKRSLGVGEWIRRGLGIAVVVGVVAIALGLDTGVLKRLSLAQTATLEQRLLDRLNPGSGSAPTSIAPADEPAAGGSMMMAARPTAAGKLPVEGDLPSLAGATTWINSPPLSAEQLRGKVVLVDFWTYSCINCLRTLPYVRAWADKYRDQGLVVIGVHAPEFAFEKNVDNVRRAVGDLQIGYPVAIDNDYAIWRGFGNQYWPAHYFIDTQGRIRFHHFGEGDYQQSEKIIRQLLREAGKDVSSGAFVDAGGSGVTQAADEADSLSPETYIGSSRAESFQSPGGEIPHEPHTYSAPASLEQNQWGLSGTWMVDDEKAVLESAPGRIVYRFHARDLHLVLGTRPGGTPVHFRVLLDGKPPGEAHGVDIDEQGQGVVSGQRLYQLIRQSGSITDRTFEIEFLDPNVEAYSFTFG